MSHQVFCSVAESQDDRDKLLFLCIHLLTGDGQKREKKNCNVFPFHFRGNFLTSYLILSVLQ